LHNTTRNSQRNISLRKIALHFCR